MKNKFWQEKTFEEMTRQEWESLCDGCGLCCQIRLEDEDTGDMAVTDIACKYLDLGKCKCTDYENRFANVDDCIQLTPSTVKDYSWLPNTCAYRLVDEGKDLFDWHPLISKNPNSVHEAGISMRGRLFSEDDIDDLEDHVIEYVEKEKVFS